MTVTLAYDPLDHETIDDPYPVYARLRELTPVLWHERLDSWVLTRFADCMAVLRDADHFAADWRRAGHVLPEGAPPPSLQGLDPPEHTPIRDLFAAALRAQDLGALAEDAARQASAVLERLAEVACFDFTDEVARPMALHVMSRLFGIAAPERASFVALSDAVERGMDAALVPETLEPAMAARRELDALVQSWGASAASTGLLAQVLRDRDALAVPEAAVWSTARVLFLAGFSTTASAAANMLLALDRHPAALERLRSASCIDTGVDELMRYDGPIQGTTRVCVEDTRIGEVSIARGQAVLLLFGAANRDPAQFERPDELVLDRQPNRHLAFGRGPHACTGTQLARITLRALLAALLRLPRPLRVIGPVERERRATVRYPNRLVVTLAPEVGA